MNDTLEVTNHVTTYKLNDETFKSIDVDQLGQLPDNWEYNQNKTPNGTQHILKRRWKCNFSKDVLPGLRKDMPKFESLAKSAWIIEDQAKQKASLGNFLGIVGASKESQFLHKAAQRMVDKGKAKTLQEAIDILS